MTAPVAGGFFQVEFWDAVGSTNDEAQMLARGGAAEGRAVVAKRQTAGRGRMGRDWSSPEGNLYLSFVLRPACSPAAAAQLSFVTAVALADALTALAPVDIRLKWPNDVLANGRKISGILLESAPSDGGVAWVVAGVGVNLASHPEGSRWPATDLAALGGRVSPAEMLAAFETAFAARYRAWREAGFAGIRAAWLARAAGLGQAIEVALGAERIAGRFADLDSSGALALALPGGGTRTIAAGEVVFAAAA